MVESIDIYKCDPKKNITCRKTACQNECFFTVNECYSVDGKPYIYNEEKQNFVPKEDQSV